MTQAVSALIAPVVGAGFGAAAVGLGAPAAVAGALGAGFAVAGPLVFRTWRARRDASPHGGGWDDAVAEIGVAPDAGPDEFRDAVASCRRRADDLLVRNRVHLFERRRVDAALDHVPYGVVITDAADRVVLCNRVAAAVLGLEGAAATGQRVDVVASELVGAADEAETTGRATLTAHGDDDDRAYLVQRHDVIDLEKRVDQGSVFTLRDITQLQSSERAQTEFISQISHELKAPLNTIVAYVEALADPDLLSEAERREYFNNLSLETERLADLIGNLLKLSRIELGNLSANFGFVKLGALVKTIVESFKPQAADNHLTMTVRVADTLGPVYGDKDLLGVAISNLVSNAIKYTPPDGRIEITATDEEDNLCISVSDTGVGIPDAVAPHVFERFVRSEQDHVVNAGGSGLGLSLVHEIAQLHQGTVTFDSVENTGTTFQLRLPQRDSEQLTLAA